MGKEGLSMAEQLPRWTDWVRELQALAQAYPDRDAMLAIVNG